MEHINISYQISKSEYRQALYHSVFLMNKGMRFLLSVGIFALVIYLYMILTGSVAIGSFLTYMFLLCIAYLVYRISSLSRGVDAYAEKPDSTIRSTHFLEMDEESFHIKLPRQKLDIERRWCDFPRAYERTEIFIFYPTSKDCCILPRRVLPDGVDEQLRDCLVEKMGDDFVSTFVHKSAIDYLHNIIQWAKDLRAELKGYSAENKAEQRRVKEQRKAIRTAKNRKKL